MARGVAVLAIAAAVFLGLWRRLQDPLSSLAIPAEDPFTHMALVRGHLLDGSLDPLYDGGRLYPPGMHAWLATVWLYTGLPIEVLFRFAPPLLGAIGLVGVALLLWRCHSPGAAVVGTLAAALAPEAIFRTTMMSPTAVDWAILPFLLIFVIETLRGRLAFAVPVAAVLGFLALSHPWLLAILAPALLGFVLAWLLLAGRLAPLGAAAVCAAVAAVLLLAVTSCWSQCSVGSRLASRDLIDTLAFAGAAGAAVAAGAFLLLRRPVGRWQGAPGWVLRGALAAALAAGLYWGSLPAFQAGLPEHVDLPHMVGTWVLALAVVGFVLQPLAPDRAGMAGAALAVVTYPFVIYNPFDSPFWPHRTAVYLALAAAILAGSAAGTIARAARAALVHLAHSRRAAWVPTLSVIVLLAAAGGTYAQAPEPYDWYRLHSDCEYEELRSVAERAPPEAIIIAGDWRPKLVMAAFAHDGRNVWFTQAFYADAEARNKSLDGLSQWAPHVIIVTDPYTQGNLSFFQQPHFRPLASECGDGTSPGVASYAFERDQWPPVAVRDVGAVRDLANGTIDLPDATDTPNATRDDANNTSNVTRDDANNMSASRDDAYNTSNAPRDDAASNATGDDALDPVGTDDASTSPASGGTIPSIRPDPPNDAQARDAA